MALLGMEGFDNLATTASGRDTPTDITFMPFGGGVPSTGIWVGAGNGAFSKVPGLLGGFAISDGNTVFARDLSCVLASNYATIIAGCRYQVASVAFSGGQVFAFQDDATVQCGLSINNLNRLIFWRGTTANILGTGTQTLVQTSWYMIEVQVTINNTTGAFDVYVDGALEISVSGVDTQQSTNAWTNKVTLQIPPTAINGLVSYDDFYLCDTTGPAPYNAPLGVIRIETTFVGANVSTGWTPLSGTNWQMVDEPDMDLDTTYNSCTAAATDLFTHTALVNTPVTVFAVDVCTSVRKNDVTNQSYRTKLVSGATTANGHTMNPATAYQYVKDTYLTDPNTGAAWTAAAINSTNVGYERL